MRLQKNGNVLLLNSIILSNTYKLSRMIKIHSNKIWKVSCLALQEVDAVNLWYFLKFHGNFLCTVAWYWNLRFWEQVLIRYTTRWCIMRAALFFALYVGCIGNFFTPTHQAKTIAIEISEDNPLAEIVSVFLFLLLYMCCVIQSTLLH